MGSANELLGELTHESLLQLSIEVVQALNTSKLRTLLAHAVTISARRSCMHCDQRADKVEGEAMVDLCPDACGEWMERLIQEYVDLELAEVSLDRFSSADSALPPVRGRRVSVAATALHEQDNHARNSAGSIILEGRERKNCMETLCHNLQGVWKKDDLVNPKVSSFYAESGEDDALLGKSVGNRYRRARTTSASNSDILASSMKSPRYSSMGGGDEGVSLERAARLSRVTSGGSVTGCESDDGDKMVSAADVEHMCQLGLSLHSMARGLIDGRVSFLTTVHDDNMYLRKELDTKLLSIVNQAMQKHKTMKARLRQWCKERLDVGTELADAIEALLPQIMQCRRALSQFSSSVQNYEDVERSYEELGSTIRRAHARCEVMLGLLGGSSQVHVETILEDIEEIQFAPPSDYKVRDWNGDYQQAVHTIQQAEQDACTRRGWGRLRASVLRDSSKYKMLYQVAHEFVDVAEMYGKIILSELGIPSHLRTIKPRAVGGIAGGEKFVHGGIFFKLTRDWDNLYGGDRFAMKAANHEVHGLSMFLRSPQHSMNMPLMCNIDYCGYRLSAMPVLPIRGHETLVYGSSDAGETFVNIDPKVEAPLRAVMEHLNIQSHRINCSKYRHLDADGNVVTADTSETKETPVCHGPCDIEVHRGTDNALYVLDFGRLLPPEPPKDHHPGVFLFQLFRPELVAKSPHPLNSDAFTRLSAESSDVGIFVAQAMLEDEVIPQFAKDMGGLSEREVARYFDIPGYLAENLHRRGINVRYMGRIEAILHTMEQQPQPGGVREALVCDMVARCVKEDLRVRLRQMNDSVSTVSRAKYCAAALRLFNLLISGTDTCVRYWKLGISELMRRKFDGVRSDLVNDLSMETINLKNMLLRVQSMSGVWLTQSAQDELAPGMLLVDPDIRALEVQVKHTHLITMAEGLTLVTKAKKLCRQGQECPAKRLFLLALRRFMDTILNNPNDNDARRRCGDAHILLALRYEDCAAHVTQGMDQYWKGGHFSSLARACRDVMESPWKDLHKDTVFQYACEGLCESDKISEEARLQLSILLGRVVMMHPYEWFGGMRVRHMKVVSAAVCEYLESPLSVVPSIAELGDLDVRALFVSPSEKEGDCEGKSSHVDVNIYRFSYDNFPPWLLVAAAHSGRVRNLLLEDRVWLPLRDCLRGTVEILDIRKTLPFLNNKASMFRIFCELSPVMSFRCLKLGYNNIGDSDIGHIETLLECESHPLNRVDLSENRLGFAGLRRLGTSLFQHETLLAIDLSRNLLGNKGASCVAELMSSNSHIAFLDLSDNEITDEGADALKRLLECKHVKGLFLRGNRIGDNGLVAMLVPVREGRSCLEELCIDNNQIGSKGGLALARAIHGSKCLRSLSLVRCVIGSAGACAIGEAIASSKSMRELNIGSRVLADIDERGAFILFQGAEQNSEFENLVIDYNPDDPSEKGSPLAAMWGKAHDRAKKARQKIKKVVAHGRSTIEGKMDEISDSLESRFEGLSIPRPSSASTDRRRTRAARDSDAEG